MTGGVLLGGTSQAETPKTTPMNIDALKKACHGTVTVAGDANFQEAIHGNLWNKLVPDRAPQIVVKADHEEDIIAAIKFARENKLKVVVRGGGHNWCQPTLRQGGLLIDIQNFNNVISIDVENRRAVIQPIISNRDVQKALNPQGLGFPTGHNGWICMVTANAFEDTPDAAKAALQPLEECPITPVSKTFATPLTFEELFDASGALWPEGLRSKVEATFSNSSPGEMMKAVLAKMQEAPSSISVFLFTIFCGPNVPAPQKNMAYSMSSKVYGGPWTMWEDAKDDKANADWHNEMTALLRPYNVGYYIGEANSVSRPATAVQAFSPENWQRLADLRDKYDPDGLFFGYFDGLTNKQT